MWFQATNGKGPTAAVKYAFTECPFTYKIPIKASKPLFSTPSHEIMENWLFVLKLY